MFLFDATLGFPGEGPESVERGSGRIRRGRKRYFQVIIDEPLTGKVMKVNKVTARVSYSDKTDGSLELAEIRKLLKEQKKRAVVRKGTTFKKMFPFEHLT